MDKGIETLRKDLIDLIDYSLDTARLYGYADADLNHSEDDYKRGYDDACFDYNRGLADGMEDAWECARKLCQSEKYGGLEEHCAEIFDRQDTFDVFDYSASEAIAKIKEYEQKQTDEIRVGDEVRVGATPKDCLEPTFVVLCIDKDRVDLMSSAGGYSVLANYDGCYKTGRHFPQIAEVLEQMKGEAE